MSFLEFDLNYRAVHNARMRRLCWLIALISLAAVGCWQSKSAEVTNSTAQSSNRVEAASAAQSRQPCVNLNTATAEELEQLPGIGEVMSRRIIEYRERHGGFRRPEEIIIIEGFSERRYRALVGLICAE